MRDFVRSIIGASRLTLTLIFTNTKKDFLARRLQNGCKVNGLGAYSNSVASRGKSTRNATFIHFIRYLEKLSAENGFGYVDLNALMAPYADKELLLYRDDTHWNERGHQIVAQLLAKYAAIAGR
jgi:lysophospholipase L1-like esterase